MGCVLLLEVQRYMIKRVKYITRLVLVVFITQVIVQPIHTLFCCNDHHDCCEQKEGGFDLLSDAEAELSTDNSCIICDYDFTSGEAPSILSALLTSLLFLSPIECLSALSLDERSVSKSIPRAPPVT